MKYRHELLISEDSTNIIVRIEHDDELHIWTNIENEKRYCHIKGDTDKLEEKNVHTLTKSHHFSIKNVTPTVSHIKIEQSINGLGVLLQLHDRKLIAITLRNVYKKADGTWASVDHPIKKKLSTLILKLFPSKKRGSFIS